MKNFFLILLLSAAFMLLSCGGSEPAADVPECGEDLSFPCADPASGLVWSEKAHLQKNWDEALFYCENLEEGGIKDWRLPNIDELRTLIQECYGTVSGGECRVSETSNCLSYDLCWSTFCYCEFDDSGKYNKFGDAGGFWSSSAASYEGAWYVNFLEAKVVDDDKGSSYIVRCVK
ncbi:DUF1566 domain-containing protein [bacterium]|nr:DUF1566 domain-containing protein [bacterium]